MKFITKSAIVALVLVALGVACYDPVLSFWKEQNRRQYRFAEVTRGEITWVANATGTIKPVNAVQVGTFVSGPIRELPVDFNSRVKKGDLLAKIDPRIYEAGVARDSAILATRQAEVDRVNSLLSKAVNDEKRALKLRDQNPRVVSLEETDELKFKRQATEAELLSAKAGVKQAQAQLAISEAELFYTDIVSPVDGIVIERAIDPGQTVAASFQTPKLFVVAPDLDKEVRIHATVDEADIGLVQEAKARAQPVHFTVDAYPDDLFEGDIYQVRMSSQITQNVVTYPVIIKAANLDLKLLPGMTANISFQIDVHENVLRVPNAALRFHPEPEEVRPQDRDILFNAIFYPTDDTASAEAEANSVSDKVTASRARNRRRVWMSDGEYLKSVEIIAGMSDYEYTEIVSDQLSEGDRLVVARQPKKRFQAW